MTLSKRKKNLARARRVRSGMATEFKRLREGEVLLLDLLESPEGPLTHARIWDVLRKAPHLSDMGSKRILLIAKVWPLTKLGELEPVEIEEIIRCLPPRARNAA